MCSSDSLTVKFQLTAPLREPTKLYVHRICDEVFQLTAPLREPTAISSHSRHIDAVSTHGSLAGADYGKLSISLQI